MSKEFYLVTEEVRDQPYPYRACGLDNIFLLNGYTVTEEDGERFVAVRNVDQLHKEIGRHVVCERKTLSGKEIRFLRNTLDMTQAELAEVLGTTTQTFARWEKGEVEIPGPAERLLRVVFVIGTAPPEHQAALMESLERMVFERMKELNALDEVRPPVGRFELGSSWHETQSVCFA